LRKVSCRGGSTGAMAATRVLLLLRELNDRLRTVERELPASFYEEARRRAWFFLAQGHVLGG